MTGQPPCTCWCHADTICAPGCTCTWCLLCILYGDPAPASADTA